jgi:hypothetical protein
MRTALFRPTYLAHLLVVVLGAGFGMCVPVESHAQIAAHTNHHCPTITCANVAVQNQSCLAPNWCNDIATGTQFPKCMPKPSEYCEESPQWGSTNCPAGVCMPAGTRCAYTLNHCIP